MRAHYFIPFTQTDDMEITITNTSDCQATLSVTVPAEDVARIKDGIIASYMKNARVPGFRPGKAPRNVIAKRYADMIAEELNSQLMGDIQDKTLADNPSLKVLDFGTPESGEQEDGSYMLTSTMTIVPEFELPEYMGLKVTVSSTDVSEEEIDEALTKYAEASARHEHCERAAALGDVAVIDFKTTVDGVPCAEHCGKPVGFMEGREGHWHSMEIDSFMPGLTEGLVGLSAGDSKDIDVVMQKEFPISELAGKTVTFSCTVTEVRGKVVPEITAELFADKLPGKSMEDIRNLVRDNIKAGKERDNDEAKAEQISDQLADKLTFSLPAELVERENENTVQRKVYAAIQEGNFSITNNMDSLREESKAETERSLRVYFALQEIANREHITATEAEMFQSITEMARQAKEKNFKNFVRKLHRENRMTGIRLSIVTSKVLDLLARNAEVTVA